MSKGIVIAIIAVGLIIIVILSCFGIYNSIVSLEEETEKSWGNVQSAYQRRFDLIPNLVATVKGYAVHEQETFQLVTEARSKAGGSVQVDAKDLTPESLANIQAMQQGLNSALSRLMVVVERYPDLKASENFKDLQIQLEGTENRINVVRQRFNEAVVAYNKRIRRFPGAIFAGMFGFEKKYYFEAVQGAEEAPEVQFD